MATDEQILYSYFLEQNKKRRSEAVELLKWRKFSELRNGYDHWVSFKCKSRKLRSSLICDVITELSKVKTKSNETEPYLYSYTGEDDEQTISIESYIFKIVPAGKCRGLANVYVKEALWKLKHQPNGRDAKGYEEIIKRHSRKN